MFRAVVKLVFGSMLGKASGVARELLLASLYGTGVVASASRAAQSSTMIPIDFFTSNALSSAFLPVYSRLRSESKERASLLFWMVLFLMLAFSAVILSMLLIWGREWVELVFPGFSLDARSATLSMLNVMAIGVPFYILGNLLSYVAMGNGDYSMASSRATVQNFGMTAGVLFAWIHSSPVLIAWGFTLSYVIYCIWGLRLFRIGAFAPFPLSWNLADVTSISGKFWYAIRPLLLLPFLLQGNAVVERMVASLISEDTVAALGYAKLVTDTGVLLIAMPLGLAGLASMSKMTELDVTRALTSILPPLLMISIPISLFMAGESESIVRLVFEHGQFSRSSTEVTHVILSGLSWGLWAQICSYFLVKVLSARMRNREVFIYMAAAIVGNVALNLALFRVLGGQALGIASSFYALVLFALASYSLGILAFLWKRIALLLLGGLIFMAGIGFTSLDLTLLGSAISAVLAVIFWVAYIASIPLLRSDATILVEFILRKFYAPK